MRMKEHATGPLYDLWAKFYDHSFGALVRRRQRIALEQLRARPGDRVLDLGVGTGITLRHYRRDVTVVGMDLSAGMLEKAAEKVSKYGLTNCHLVQCDAMRPPFADHSFDHVMITHVISVVSDPSKLLYWARRMVKPGGRIVVLNHFMSSHAPLAWFERTFNPLFVKIGWRSDLSLGECLTGDASDLHVQYRFKVSLIDFWQIVVLADRPRPAPEQEPAPHARLAVEGS